MPITETDLQAYVDGRLSPASRIEVENFLAARPDEAARIAAYRSQREALHGLYDAVLHEPVPERLLNNAGPGRRGAWRWAAAVALFALGAAVGWRIHGDIPGSDPALAAEHIAHSAAIAHVTYSPEVRHPVEVGVDQEDHLVAWLSKRLGAKVRAPKLETAGYGLVGGRLLPGEASAQPVAQFMYQCKKGTRVTLYVRAGAGNQGVTAFRHVQDGKVGVFYWIDRDFGYALSSADISKDDLLKVANTAYLQLNP